jgi:ribonuclease G
MRREILIDSSTEEIRIAVVEDGVLVELLIDRPAGRSVAGNIYKGRVYNVLPGMQSAFVDIGLERHAFLCAEDVGGEDEADEQTGLPVPRPRIELLLQEGQEMVVQVLRDPLRHKGARVASHVSLPGRWLVHLPGAACVWVSRRIESPQERERLKSLVTDLTRDLGIAGGFIVRTAAEGLAAEAFADQARLLSDLWEQIRQRAAGLTAPVLLHEEAGTLVRILRDVFTRDVHQVRVDTVGVYRRAIDEVGRMEPALLPRIQMHAGPGPIFAEHGIEEQIDRALRPHVWLKSGGAIVINQTEALVAIDVNTGKYVGKRRLEETILKTNLEAAREIVRQVRLRDLGGIIVIDFIDMADGASKEEVVHALESELKKDRSKWRMLPMSEFGLVEITRQRTRGSLENLLCRPCQACHGTGRTKSVETIAFEIRRRILGPGGEAPCGVVVVRVHPEVAVRLEADLAARASGLDGDASRILIERDPALRPEQFRVEEA